MHRIPTTDGISLQVSDEGRGAAVVLVAGFTAPATTWALQRDALLAAGYRVLCLDRRSHGLSDSPPFGQRMARHGADLNDTLVALALSDVVLVGSSMGASTIWAFLDLFGSGRVRGVVGIDQTPRMRNSADWPYGYYGLDDGNAGTFFSEGIPVTGRGLSDEAAAVGIMRLVERLGPDAKLTAEIKPETMPLLHDHAQQDWRDVIARLDKPQLLIAGRQSQLWPCEHAAAAVAESPLGRAVVIDEAGHSAMLDQVETFNAILLDFLGGL